MRVEGAPSPATIALAGLLLLAAAMGIGRFAYTPLLPPLQATLDWSVAQSGDVASANFLGYMLGALAVSGLARSRHRARWLLLGMIASALTTLAGAWLTSFPGWLLLRLASGLASGCCLVIGTAMVVEALAWRHRANLVGWHFAGVGVGIIGSVLVVEVGKLFGAPVFQQWANLGLVALALMVAAYAVLRRLPPPTGEIHAASDQPPHRGLPRLILAYGCFGFGYVVTATFIVVIARRVDPGGWLEPGCWIVVGLLAAPSVLVWQRIVARLGLLSSLRLAYAVEATGVLLVGFAPGAGAVLVGGALLGATFMGITALGLSAGRQLAGRHQGAVIGWMTGVFGLGQLLGPAVAGRLAALTGGFQWPSLLAAGLLGLGILLLWRLET